MMLTPVTAVPYFDEAGAGDTTILMLHGVGGGRQAFAPQLPAFANAGYQAVAWDMPGYGHSAVVDPYDFATIADECIELIDVLAPERLVLVGHSMGGMVAQEVAARAPERIDALVLAATSPAFGKADGEWQRAFIAERTAPLDAGRTMHELATSLIPTMGAAEVAPEAVAAATDVMSHVPPSTYRLALQALMGFDRRAALKALTIPTLFIAGREDRVAPSEMMRGMADRVAGSQFVCLDDCGHLMMFEKPDAFNAAVMWFVKSTLGAVAR